MKFVSHSSFSQSNFDGKITKVTILMHLTISKLVCNKVPGGSTCCSPDPALGPDMPWNAFWEALQREM